MFGQIWNCQANIIKSTPHIKAEKRSLKKVILLEYIIQFLKLFSDHKRSPAVCSPTDTSKYCGNLTKRVKCQDISRKKAITQTVKRAIDHSKGLLHLPALSFDPEELSLSTLGFFFLCDPESEEAGLFSTAGVDRALFLNSSLSLSRAGSILPGRTHNAQKRRHKSFRLNEIMATGQTVSP